ncbi:arginine transporter [Rhodobacteraceae bacterium LMO-12]|nr:arginine transporter [Rhodobacteraceae bacterium LMO-JJ12]
MRILIALTVCLALAACGGYRKAGRDVGQTTVRVPVKVTNGTKVAAQPLRLASGPISKACLASDRKARSREKCGCIQAVANDSLNSSDQRLAASFYSDPHRAQVIRQSDNSGHERFWQSYKAYAEAAEATCG